MRGKRTDYESGMAIILAMFFMVIASGLVASGVIMMKSNTDMAEVRYRRESQAKQFARSGLTEALSWFRLQSKQPVAAFAPVLDTTATPKIMETDDPVIGLVRDFEIEDGIWGRYEVWKEDELDLDPKRLAFRRKYQAADLSVSRGFTAAGSVWLIRAVGYVYEKKSSTAKWNVRPNRVLAVSTLESEIGRLVIQLPSSSAVSVSSGPLATINTKGRIRGGTTGAGIYYPTGPGPNVGPKKDNRVTGTPATQATASYDASIDHVFGVTKDDLRSMADLVITDPNDFPDPIPDNAIVFVETPLIVFDASRALNGTGIVVVFGTVQLIPGNNSNFTGLLYVDGTFTMREKSDIFGAVICTMNMTVQGALDYATIWFDAAAISTLNREVGQYRWSGAFRSVHNYE